MRTDPPNELQEKVSFSPFLQITNLNAMRACMPRFVIPNIDLLKLVFTAMRYAKYVKTMNATFLELCHTSRRMYKWY
jgi:hypothetical protein